MFHTLALVMLNAASGRLARLAGVPEKADGICERDADARPNALSSRDTRWILRYAQNDVKNYLWYFAISSD